MNDPAPIRRPATYQDVLDAPPNMVAELVDGALRLHPRPASRHARASFKIAARLDDPFENGVGGPGGWYFAIEPELNLGENVVVPDVAGWRRVRMPAYPDLPAIELAPDWACELLSPATRRFDLTTKRALYGARGVGHLWLIDPAARTLEAFELRDAAWVLIAALEEDAEVRLAPFAAIGLPARRALAGLKLGVFEPCEERRAVKLPSRSQPPAVAQVGGMTRSCSPSERITLRTVPNSGFPSVLKARYSASRFTPDWRATSVMPRARATWPRAWQI